MTCPAILTMARSARANGRECLWVDLIALHFGF